MSNMSEPTPPKLPFGVEPGRSKSPIVAWSLVLAAWFVFLLWMAWRGTTG